MKRRLILSFFVLLAFSFYVSAQSLEEQMFVTDEKLVGETESCGAGFVNEANFTANDGSIVKVCVKRQVYGTADDDLYVLHSGFYGLDEEVECPAHLGVGAGSFSYSEGRMDLCVLKGSYSEGAVSDVRVLDGEGCQRQGDIISIASFDDGRKVSHCVSFYGETYFPGSDDASGGTDDVPPADVEHGETPTCEEVSDIEQDIYLRGEIIVNGESKFDECRTEGGKKVRQYACKVSNSFGYTSSEDDCGEGFICREGACVEPEDSGGFVPRTESVSPETESGSNCERAFYGLAFFEKKSGSDLCREDNGEEFLCDSNEPPSCTGFGQLWPWNWFLCSGESSCEKQFTSVDLMVTCCSEALEGENSAESESEPVGYGAISKWLGDELISFLIHQDRNRNPGMIQNIRDRYDEGREEYVFGEDYLEDMLSYLTPLNPGMAQNIRDDWNDDSSGSGDTSDFESSDNCEIVGMPAGLFWGKTGTEVCAFSERTCEEVLFGSKSCDTRAPFFGCKECLKCCSS